MRTYHRWTTLFFGLFLLWIATTGLLSQIVPLVLAGQPPAAAPAGGFVCPPDYTCRPKPAPGDPRALIGLLHHLHSGESFGPIGTAIGTLSGFAMLFFSFSGLWMYLKMWKNRAGRQLKPAWLWR